MATGVKSPSTRNPVLDRILHLSYFRATGVNSFFASRLRPAGIGLCLMLILASVIGIGQQRISVYQIFALSLGMAMIGLVWAFSRGARLSAKRELPRHATAGETMRYSVRVSNLSRSQLHRAWIAESPPDSRPEFREFRHQREPGENERNWFDRALAYYRWQWLLNRKRIFDGGASHDGLRLAPGEETRVSMQLKPLRRGVIRLDDLRVLLPDPFGFFQRRRRITAPAGILTVLPRRFPLPPIRLAGDAAFQIGGEDTTNAIGNSGEFVGLRDYRPGDPMRQIHWKSWARTGRPIVKELEDTYYPRYGLVLDTHSPAGGTDAFESAVSVAASFVASLDKSDCLLDLMFIGDQAHRVTAGRGLERADKLLEVLAGVTTVEDSNFENLAKLVLRHREDLTSCIVILNGWDSEREEFLGSLARGGVRCSPLIIADGPRPTRAPGYWLATDRLAKDLLSLPGQLSTMT